MTAYGTRTAILQALHSGMDADAVNEGSAENG
jgi:hypothetical protein